MPLCRSSAAPWYDIISLVHKQYDSAALPVLQMGAKSRAAGPSSQTKASNQRQSAAAPGFGLKTMAWISLPILALVAGLVIQGRLGPSSSSLVCAEQVPPQAQIISQKSFNVLPSVPPPTVVNGTRVFKPPGFSDAELLAKPFHIYDDEFYAIIGCNPTLTIIASSEKDPLFHEAVVWYPPTDEVFFVQNAGAKAAGTGLAKSAIVEKISLSEADLVTNLTDASGRVTVHTVDSNPTVVNPNGNFPSV